MAQPMAQPPGVRANRHELRAAATRARKPPKLPKLPRPPGAEAVPRAALISIEETRRQLGGTSRSNVYKLIGARKIRSVKIGRRRFIVAASIDELIRRHAR